MSSAVNDGLSSGASISLFFSLAYFASAFEIFPNVSPLVVVDCWFQAQDMRDGMIALNSFENHHGEGCGENEGYRKRSHSRHGLHTMSHSVACAEDPGYRG
jgi:hypothetical protein